MSISLLTLDDLRDVERRQASVLEPGTLMERAGSGHRVAPRARTSSEGTRHDPLRHGE